MSISKSSTPRPSIPPRASTSSLNTDEYAPVIERLQTIYNRKIRPLETTYNFEGFHSAPLTGSDIGAKPIVLLLGQYSTGKTSFIRSVIGKQYPGEHIGVEPTTDRFVAVMHGNQDRIIPGNAAAVNSELPFRGLDRFGQAFLSRFQVSQTNCPVLENMTIIDTPGILAGDKQRVDRGYDFTEVVEWFANRADLILLMFDSHKLDISNEFRMAITTLKGHEEKVRVVLNKSDMVSQQQLMRVYGAMMWSLGKVIQTPEVLRVYLTSFWVEKPANCFEECRDLIEAEQKDLLKDLRNLRRNAAIRKVNDIVKRARIAKIHALIISHLKKEMPALFGKKKKQEALLANLEGEFIKIQQTYHLAPGDFPNPARFKQSLIHYDFDKFRPYREEVINMAEQALSKDLPKVMSMFPHTAQPELAPSERNPFQEFDAESAMANNELPPSYWHADAVDASKYKSVFQGLEPNNGIVSGSKIKPVLMNTGLDTSVLADIWRLSDYDNDGAMDMYQFALAMHLVTVVKNGGELPEKLPSTLQPKFNGI
ncbi:hypothetical protein K450DRAFT_255725 [Umbelopsis ramanniana AG]|uniref:P-loop containing nucleoside triphosphate hydrolase protein n=1 Tax=Umbelopsis ramanniana AG TaxID=1314678 RepID=A0AAD5E6Q7_UMBRA|nr:uncharacterized protein K450DRAFT_255725 [Umbelopsis ramanniana AG]KAI8576700.1 hypothetical protein K450DRAFT_255725 [Umbelopsis ramanniana AG]